MLYFFDALPVHPQPQFLEAFTSFIPWLAVANGIQAVDRMSTLCFPSKKVRLRRFADYPLLSFEELPNLSACSTEKLRLTTFYYLVDLFGKSTHPQHASRFLAGAVAESLRYCPMCIRARPRYILPWRFHMLTGCIIHQCRLRERCLSCGLHIPLLSPSFRIGECPNCGVDLTIGDTEELSDADYEIVQRRYRDLERLLQPHSIHHLPAPVRQRLLGNQFALMRAEQRLSVNTVTNHLGITADALRGMEWGTAEKGGANFATYIAYADLLNISFQKIVYNTFSVQRPEIEIARDVLGRRRAVYVNGASTPTIKPDNPLKRWTDEALVKAIEQIKNHLASQGRTETGTTILGMLGLRRQALKSYPQAESLYKDLVSQHQQQRRALYQERVTSAIHELQISGTPLSERRIEQTSGVSYSTIHRWPELRELVSAVVGRPLEPKYKRAEGASSTQITNTDARLRREDELLAQVEAAISRLKEQDQNVTQIAIAAMMNKSVSGLMKYSRIRTRLQRVANHARNQVLRYAKQLERESRLLQQVMKCIAILSKDGSKPTQEAVAAQIGKSVPALRKYSSIRKALNKLVQTKRQKQDTSEN
jgi:hypothetical protein